MEPQQQPSTQPEPVQSEPTLPAVPTQPVPEVNPQPDLAQPASQIEPQPDQDSEPGTEVIAPTPSFTWEASEFVHHEKPAFWYGGLILGIIIVCGVLGVLHQWLSIAVVVLMALAIFMYSRKVPRTLQYALDGNGVSINGRVAPYTNFKSYNVHQDLGWREIDLEPTKRFAPRLTLLAEDESFEQIAGILSQHLPEIARNQDIIEKISRYIKF